MAFPDNLDSRSYYEQLVVLRDDALRRSYWFGGRTQLGALSFGLAAAYWRAEDGGTAILTDRGLRLGNNTPWVLRPTVLRLSRTQSTDPGLGESTEFRMELDDLGMIDVYRNLTTSRFVRDGIRAALSRRGDRRHELSVPTDEDLALVYLELQRGASGAYKLDDAPMGSEWFDEED